MDDKVIVLYGGSFNPPTNAHILLAQEILDKYNQVSKVIFMPVSCKYNKKGLIDNEHRYNMLKLACNKNPKFEVSRIEIESQRQLYTIETLEILQKQFPSCKLWFTIGTDNLRELNIWKRPEELMTRYKILILERGSDNMWEIIDDDELLKKYKEAFLNVGNTKTELSSSTVRKDIAQGVDISEETPKEVQSYIKEFNLYMD